MVEMGRVFVSRLESLPLLRWPSLLWFDSKLVIFVVCLSMGSSWPAPNSRGSFASRLGPVQSECVPIHSGGQPDSFCCFLPCFLLDDLTRLWMGPPANLLPIREILRPHVWGQSFRRAGRGILLAPSCVCGFVPWKWFELIGLSRNHPRRQPWLVTNSRDCFFFVLLPFGAGPCGGQPRLSLSKS
ncbi:hypothetical protein HDV63DRAFT_67539 [Trichoderma sp. SZMC 28014]